METPEGFTHLAELRIDWARVVDRLGPRFRSYLIDVDTKDMSLLTSGFNKPVLCIPKQNYSQLNSNTELCYTILSTVNSCMVHKFGGIKFVKPLEGKDKALIDELIKEFDAEVLDTFEEENDQLTC